MNLNIAFTPDYLASNINKNGSEVEVFDYHVSENGTLKLADDILSHSLINTFDVLSEILLNRSMFADTFDFVGSGNNTSLIEFINGTEFRGYVPSFRNNILVFVLSFFCFVTVFGNVLVMAAVIKEPYLHTVTNYFIASLATADLIVGTIVMPFCVILEVTDGYWPFGQDWCDIWRSIDVLASTASIMNLCVISLDRYWAITDSMNYPNKMTPKRAALVIAGVWLLSALISFPAIVWWRLTATGPPPVNQCLFTNDLGYLLFSSIISFYGPLVIMLVTYCRIYHAAQLQKKSLRLGTKQVHANGAKHPSLTLRIHRGGMNSPNLEQDLGDGHDRNNDVNENTTLRPPHRQVKSFSLSRKISKLAKEKKAAKTLGIVMGVFIVCWLPFFICNILIGLCGEKCFKRPKLVFSFVTWLGWTNSGMNPVIYALWSREFRRAFIRILLSYCPKFIRRRFMPRSRFRQAMRDDFTFPHLKSTNGPSTIEDINL